MRRRTRRTRYARPPSNPPRDGPTNGVPRIVVARSLDTDPERDPLFQSRRARPTTTRARASTPEAPPDAGVRPARRSAGPRPRGPHFAKCRRAWRPNRPYLYVKRGRDESASFGVPKTPSNKNVLHRATRDARLGRLRGAQTAATNENFSLSLSFHVPMARVAYSADTRVASSRSRRGKNA